MCSLFLGIASSIPSSRLLQDLMPTLPSISRVPPHPSRHSTRTSCFCSWRSCMVWRGSRQGWGGGALPRWRPPLTPSFFIFGLYSLTWLYGQVCALLAWCGIRVLALSHCINRGSFSSIGMRFLAQKLWRISIAIFCLRFNKVDDFGGQCGSSLFVMIHLFEVIPFFAPVSFDS